MRFLLDTNVISELYRLRPDSLVAIQYARNIRGIAIASVTWHELLYGCYRSPSSRKRRELESFFHEIIRPNIVVLNYDESAAEWFAAERARLTSIGRPPAYADGQIAAIAAVNNLVLVTRNVSDYVHFPELRIENWFTRSTFG